MFEDYLNGDALAYAAEGVIGGSRYADEVFAYLTPARPLGWLVTRPEFGCVQYEPNEGEEATP